MSEFTDIKVDLAVNRVIEGARLSFSESKNDILRRLLIREEQASADQAVVVQHVPVTELDAPRFGSRTMGYWQAGLSGNIVAASSLKDAYCKFLLLAHQHDPDFLNRFATLKGRTRYYAARDPLGLYLKSPHLARDHAIELTPGWFVDTNLSEAQIGQRIRAACRTLGVSYGSAAWIREATRTI